MQGNEYHYHDDPLFEKMHTRLAWRMMEMDDLDSVESGVYSYDLVVRWYDAISKQPVGHDGLPITIDMLPFGVFAHEIVEETFPELNIIKRAAIGQAWYELRDSMFGYIIDRYNDIDDELTDTDLVCSIAQHMHIVPANDLENNPRVPLRLFSNLDTALTYGRD